MTGNSRFKKANTTYFKDDLGDTPLFHAAWAKSPKNAKFLIREARHLLKPRFFCLNQP